MTRNASRRRKLFPRVSRRTKPGATPGTVAPDPASCPPVIRVMAYGPDKLVEHKPTSLAELQPLLAAYPVVWVNIDGLGNGDMIQELGQMFGLHRLALEDVVNIHQRAKVEQYGDHLFVVAREIHCEGGLHSEQISMFIGRNFVLTLQEEHGDNWDPVRERLRQSVGRIRGTGPDYLAYALLDATIDSYFPAVEQIGERVEELDAEVTRNPHRAVVAQVHEIRTELHLLRRAIWPHREMISSLAREGQTLITDETRIYLRDCYDHTIQIIDLVETDRDLCSDLRDFYLSAISNRMNEIMKVLTVIATIFMPLSFIASVYGMNFDTAVSRWNMPELKWPYGYPAVLCLMAGVAALMLYFFHRRGWLGK